MSIVVIGATGHLGRLAVESLLQRGVEPAGITATGRSVHKLDDLAARGVNVVKVDLDDRAAIDGVLTGARQVLLISATEPQRVQQHGAVIDAAVAAGVQHLVYTSAPHADTTSMLLAADHRATERLLAASGLTTTVLRNAWYVENYTGRIDTLRQFGLVGAAGDGLLSIAPRRDYADAAAAALVGSGHENGVDENKVYELGGPAVTLAELAAVIGEVDGNPIGYTDVPVEQLQQILAGAGVPAPMDAVLADVDRAISVGELQVDPADLEGLLGRPATPLAQAVKEALA